MFPKKFQGAIFSASTARGTAPVPVGARVMVTYLKEDGTGGQSEPFARRLPLDENAEYLGRPVDRCPAARRLAACRMIFAALALYSHLVRR